MAAFSASEFSSGATGNILVGLPWQAVGAAFLPWAIDDHSEQPCVIRTSTVLLQLPAHRSHWCRVAAHRTSCGAAFDRTVANVRRLHILDYPKIDTSRTGIGHETQRHRSAAFLRQPQRPHQRNFRPAAGSFAADGPRPQVRNRRRAVGILRIKLGQLLLGLLLDPLAPLADLVRELLTVLRDVLQHHLVEQHGDGVEIAGEGVSADAEGFERNAAAAGERIDDERPGARLAAQGFVAPPA